MNEREMLDKLVREATAKGMLLMGWHTDLMPLVALARQGLQLREEPERIKLAKLLGWDVVGWTEQPWADGKKHLIGYYKPIPNIESAAQEEVPQFDSLLATLTAEIEALKSQLVNFSTNEKSFIADRERAFEQELEGLREDREMLDWLLKYITQNGAKGVEAMDWHVLKDDDGDFSDRSEIVFDRTAIRQAMKETK